MSEKKITKKEQFTNMLEVVSFAIENDYDAEVCERLRTFIETEIATLDRRAESARERAAKKKAEGDELRETLYNCLTSDYKTLAMLVEDVQAATGDITISPQKLTHRMKALVDGGRAEKDEVSVEMPDGKTAKRTGYRLAQ